LAPFICGKYGFWWFFYIFGKNWLFVVVSWVLMFYVSILHEGLFIGINVLYDFVFSLALVATKNGFKASCLVLINTDDLELDTFLNNLFLVSTFSSFSSY